VGFQTDFTEDLAYSLIESGVAAAGSFKLPRRLVYDEESASSESLSKQHVMISLKRSRPCQCCYAVASELDGKYFVEKTKRLCKPFSNSAQQRCAACNTVLCSECLASWSHIRKQLNVEYKILKLIKLRHAIRDAFPDNKLRPCYACIKQLDEICIDYKLKRTKVFQTRSFCFACEVYLCASCIQMGVFDHNKKSLIVDPPDSSPSWLEYLNRRLQEHGKNIVVV
jgi:hypothetical protein